MRTNTAQRVAKELHAFHVHFQMRPSERHINPVGMGGAGKTSYNTILFPVFRSLKISFVTCFVWKTSLRYVEIF